MNNSYLASLEQQKLSVPTKYFRKNITDYTQIIKLNNSNYKNTWNVQKKRTKYIYQNLNVMGTKRYSTSSSRQISYKDWLNILASKIKWTFITLVYTQIFTLSNVFICTASYYSCNNWKEVQIANKDFYMLIPLFWSSWPGFPPEQQDLHNSQHSITVNFRT